MLNNDQGLYVTQSGGLSKKNVERRNCGGLHNGDSPPVFYLFSIRLEIISETRNWGAVLWLFIDPGKAISMIPGKHISRLPVGSSRRIEAKPSM